MTAVYSAPGWRRLVVAFVYAAVVVCVVSAMESSASPLPTPTAQVADATAVAVRVESTYPVARWAVLVDGRPVSGSATATTWSGSISGREVLVQAERADAADLSPGALRLHIGSRAIVAWGEGTVSVQGSLP
ncbi:MAG: hypothetical protein AAB263_08505 [Planctomycetota bacterium]